MLKKTAKELNPKYIQIWETVTHIPKGKVASYGQIADLAGLPGRSRLVGKALKEAPVHGWKDKKIPWHRVINSQGVISFAVGSDYFEKQKQLLQNEQVVINGRKIVLADFQWQPELSELLHLLSF